MNEDSLYIHSFLMHKDIPILRYFHAPCHSSGEWLKAVKKLNIQACAVVSCMSKDDKAVMNLHPVGKSDEGFKDLPLITPFSLILGEEGKISLRIPESLCQSERLCFPCADARESVVISSADFMERFIPEAHISIAH